MAEISVRALDIVPAPQDHRAARGQANDEAKARRDPPAFAPASEFRSWRQASSKAAQEQLATIAGQKPNIRRAKKSVAAFKLREGMPVGLTVTLRGVRAYEFLDRLVSIAIPRIRDFRGLNPRSFDGRGNYSMGVREQVIFPEIDYDSVDQVRGLDVTLTTSAETDAEAFALLDALGMPFARDGRPQGYESLKTELATA